MMFSSRVDPTQLQYYISHQSQSLIHSVMRHWYILRYYITALSMFVFTGDVLHPHFLSLTYFWDACSFVCMCVCAGGMYMPQQPMFGSGGMPPMVQQQQGMIGQPMPQGMMGQPMQQGMMGMQQVIIFKHSPRKMIGSQFLHQIHPCAVACIMFNFDMCNFDNKSGNPFSSAWEVFGPKLELQTDASMWSFLKNVNDCPFSPLWFDFVVSAPHPPTPQPTTTPTLPPMSKSVM